MSTVKWLLVSTAGGQQVNWCPREVRVEKAGTCSLTSGRLLHISFLITQFGSGCACISRKQTLWTRSVRQPT